ncbi:MAG: HD family hydrolase [Enterobacter hormaechei]
MKHSAIANGEGFVQPKTGAGAAAKYGEENKTSYIQTLSGKKFDYLNSTTDDVEIGYCDRTFPHLPLYGHLPEFYSVAQHSVLCSKLCRQSLPLKLMHDAAEAYCRHPAPLKALLPDYRRTEERVEQLIRAKFSITDMSAVVKYADLVMLPRNAAIWISTTATLALPRRYSGSDIIRLFLRPGQAYGLFINRFNELTVTRMPA